MKNRFLGFRWFFFYSFLIFLVSGCTITQSKYQRKYNEAWNKTIKSQAWKEALIAKEEEETPLYASTDDNMILPEETIVISNNLDFNKKYQSLVSRAYFKIITEAEKADVRISTAYELMNQQENNSGIIDDKLSKRNKEEIIKKYKAHRAMLEGLKSWNIFSEDKSGDLDYFKAENKESILQMMERNETNEKMIHFLIYKLADLYHIEE